METRGEYGVPSDSDKKLKREQKIARLKQYAAEFRKAILYALVGATAGGAFLAARDVVSSRQAPPPFPTPASEGFNPDEINGTAIVPEDTLPTTEPTIEPTASPVPPALPTQPTSTETATATATATDTTTATATELPAHNFPNTLDEALAAVAQKNATEAHTYGEPLSFKFGERTSVLFINYALLEQPDTLPGAVWGIKELQLYLTAFEQLAANPELAQKVDVLVQRHARGSAPELFLVFANVSAPPDPNYATVITRTYRRNLLLFENWLHAKDIFDGYTQLHVSNSEDINKPSGLKTGIAALDTATEGSVEQHFRQEFDVLFHVYHEAFGHALARTEFGMTELSKQFFTVFYTTQNGVNITLDHIEDPTPYAMSYIELEAYANKYTSRDGVEDFADSLSLYLTLAALEKNPDYQFIVQAFKEKYKLRLAFIENMLRSADAGGPDLTSITAEGLLKAVDTPGQ